MTDLLVVGGGLAGSIAAIAAARSNPEATVQLLAPNEDRFAFHPGTIGVLGSLPDAADANQETADTEDTTAQRAETVLSGGRVTNPLEAIEHLPETHPYRIVGRDAVSDGLSLCDDVLGYHGSETNALLPTPAGTVRPVFRYPPGMAAGVVSRPEPMRLIGFEQVPDLAVEYVGDRLSELVPYDIGTATVAFPGTVTEYPAAAHLADALDADEPPQDEVGLPELDTDGELPPGLLGEPEDDGSLREQLRERILAELDTEPRIGVPAVLGKRDHDAIRSELEAAFGARIFEIPLGPPSVPGRRLETTLQQAVREAGVKLQSGDIEAFETRNGHIEHVSIAPDRPSESAQSAQELAVDSVILATGDFVTDGVQATGRTIREPRFDCPVSHPERAAWTTANPLESQPFSRFGVRIDDRCRALAEDGQPVYDNLRVAGRIIGGVDYDREASGDGVAIATGLVAGRSAME